MRQRELTIQFQLTLERVRGVLIYQASAKLQQAVEQTMLAYIAEIQKADAEVKQAEQTLLRALGLEGWQPPEPLTYTRRASEAFTANRIDSDYYSPAKYAALAALAALPHRLLGERCAAIREMFDPARAERTLQVRNFDLTEALHPSLGDEIEPVLASELGSAKKQLRTGDVVISRLRSYLREIAVVCTSLGVLAVSSSEFIVLRPHATQHPQVTPETLMIFLRSFPVQTVLKWCQDGSHHPRFGDEDLLSIPMPDVVLEISPTIDLLVNAALEARRTARELLERAKRAVEIAIEQNETAALRYLDQRPE